MSLSQFMFPPGPAGLLLAAALTACGSQDGAVHVQGRSQIDNAALDEQRITLQAPAGEWRAVRLLIDETFWGGENEVSLGLGVESSGASSPYMALGSYISISDLEGVPLVVFFGFPEGESDGFVIHMSRDEGEPPVQPRVELAFVFGSNQGPALLHLGKLSADDPRSGLGLVQALAGRPEQAHGEDGGTGGFVGSYARFVDDNGELREIRSGRMAVKTSGPVPTTGGFSVLETTRLSGQAEFRAGGWFSLAFFAQPETGLQDWSIEASLPPQRVSESGLWANAGPVQPPVQVELLGLSPAGFFVQGLSEQGPAELNIERTLSGRDGPSTEAVPAGLFASWGWVSTDFEALYGWPMQAIEADAGDE